MGLPLPPVEHCVFFSTEPAGQQMGEASTRLREARIKAGFATAADAARHFGWPAPTYFQHEGGQRGIRRKVAEVYASAFAVTPEYLMFGTAVAVDKGEPHGFASFLKGERQRRGWTQEEPARRAEVSQQAIAFWEHGKSMPRSAGAIKLAKVLGITVEDMPLAPVGREIATSGVLEVPLDLDPDLLASWRTMNPDDRKRLVMIARVFASQRRT